MLSTVCDRASPYLTLAIPTLGRLRPVALECPSPARSSQLRWCRFSPLIVSKKRNTSSRKRRRELGAADCDGGFQRNRNERRSSSFSSSNVRDLRCYVALLVARSGSTSLMNGPRVPFLHPIPALSSLVTPHNATRFPSTVPGCTKSNTTDHPTLGALVGPKPSVPANSHCAGPGRLIRARRTRAARQLSGTRYPIRSGFAAGTNT